MAELREMPGHEVARYAEWRIPKDRSYAFWPECARRWRATSPLYRLLGIMVWMAAFGLLLFAPKLAAAANLIFFLFAVSRDLFSSRLPKGIGELVADSRVMPHSLVKIRYSSGNLEYGQDFGYLTHHDGWLTFIGCESEFHLRRIDAELSRTSYEWPPKTYIVCGSQKLEVIALGAKGQPSRSETRQLRYYLEEWWQRNAVPNGAPTLPPAVVHPSVLGFLQVKRKILGLFCLALPVFFVPMALSMGLGPLEWRTLLVVLSAIGLLLCGATLFANDRQQRQLRRLGRNSGAKISAPERDD